MPARRALAQGASVELTIETPPPGLAFSPTFIKVEEGAEVTVTLMNTWEGSGPQTIHSFTIESLDVAPVIRPGETMEVTFSLPADEPYVAFLCTVAAGAHLRSGMQGAFYFA